MLGRNISASIFCFPAVNTDLSKSQGYNKNCATDTDAFSLSLLMNNFDEKAVELYWNKTEIARCIGIFIQHVQAISHEMLNIEGVVLQPENRASLA